MALSVNDQIWWTGDDGEAAVTVEEVRQAINAASIEDQRVHGLCCVCGAYSYEPICPPCERDVIVHCRYGEA